MLLAPAVVVLVLVSSQTGFSRYIRYVLPVFPFAFIWISSVARGMGSVGNALRGVPRTTDGAPIIRSRNATEGVPYRITWSVAALAVALLAWSIGSSLWYAPHWMSYFNELAGGPLGGPAHLIDAQVDWGQDLLYLKRWLDSNPHARPLGLVYFGPIDPRLSGVEFSLPPKGKIVSDDRAAMAEPPRELQPGWYAVSVNYLYGYPHYIYDGNGGRESVNRPFHSYFRRFRPVATAGYSIYIYHLTPRDMRTARNANPL